MNVVVRSLVGVAAGIASSLILIVAVELFSAVVHPVPSNFGGSHQEICEHVANYPPWVLAVVVPMWAGIAFLGTWVAGRLAGRGSAVVLALLLLAAVIGNVTMLPYPRWFKIVQPIVILIAVGLGYRRSIRPQHAAIAG